MRSIKVFAILAFLSAALFLLIDGELGSRANAEDEVSNHLPEIADLHHDKVGIGQRLCFGIEVIDEEGDYIRVEVTEKPKSAKYNENTLTVDWTPTVADGTNGKFVVRVTEMDRKGKRPNRSVKKEFNIAVVKDRVKLKKLPKTSVEVDAFVSVIDPERLAAAKKRWGIINMLQRIGEIEADKQIKPGSGVKPSNGKQLFREMLKQLAVLHRNPTVDPDQKNFNSEWNADNWELVAVRPRINKKVFELRLVYFNTTAPEQSYIMPRMRIIRGDDAKRPDRLRQKNNYVFAKKFHETFFDGENMKDFVKNDKAKYGEALADFITWALTYDDPLEPMMKANFAALPHNSRLGGGNAYDANGKYMHGDGWALGAFKVGPVMKNGERVLGITSPPIAGFVASIKPTADGSKFTTGPAPVNDAESDEYRKGWEKLYDSVHGTVHVPEVRADGTVTKAVLDTAIVGQDWKFEYMQSETKLRDTRRRLFEEKGMTCIQCHVRNFDEGDYLQSVQKPKKGIDKVVNRKIPRVFFVIIPTLHLGRNEYIHREEQEQVGNLQGVFRDYLGIDVKMSTPLSLDWVHSTKKGRS